jgi:ketosteroid isomerase-like protein
VAVTVAMLPQAIVLCWIDAFNVRDLDGMLQCFDEDVRFHPVRLGGLSSCYRGHRGVSEWFALLRRRPEHRIVVTEVHALDEDRVAVVGSLSLGADPVIASFCGLHRVRAGRIVTAHHYLTDPEMIEYLGLIP